MIFQLANQPGDFSNNGLPSIFEKNTVVFCLQAWSYAWYIMCIYIYNNITYVFIYTFIELYSTYTYTYIYIIIYTHLCIHILKPTYIYICTYIYIFIYLSMHILIYIYLDVFAHDISIYISISIYIYTYIYSYIYILTLPTRWWYMSIWVNKYISNMFNQQAPVNQQAARAGYSDFPAGHVWWHRRV